MVKPRTIFCHDNLPVMRGMNSQSVDLIYLDPPFNKGRHFHAPIGSTAEGADFSDIWTADSVKDEWHNQINDKHPKLYKYLDAVGDIGSRSAKYYLIYMAVRLMEMRRILKDTGSIYLHCDPTASHYLKLLMDTIFGHGCFRNEIVWYYSGWNARLKGKFNSRHDIVLMYVKNKQSVFNSFALSWKSEEEYLKTRRQKVHVDDIGKYVLSDAGNGKRVKRYLHEAMQYGKPISDVWAIDKINNSSKERVGYPTQKPLTLLERVVSASSEEQSLVLDPFCGCATTCVAAERLKRQWIGIDVSKKAYDLVIERLNKEIAPDLFRGTPFFTESIPTRTDIAHKKAPTREDKWLLFGKQNSLCVGCYTKFEIQHLEVDHIIPQAQGGSHEQDNLQLLCGHCNRVKGDRPMEYLRAKIKAAA